MEYRANFYLGLLSSCLTLLGALFGLLLLYQGPRREDLHRLARKAFPGLPLELHAYTEEEAARLEAVLARMREGALRLRP